jgi:hypothetical protein
VDVRIWLKGLELSARQAYLCIGLRDLAHDEEE